MRRTLKNDLQEGQFQEEGYIKVPFLDAEEVEQLKQAYFNSLNKSGGHLGPQDEKFQTKETITYDFTFIDKNIDYKKEVFQIITDAFKEKSNDLLDNYEPIIANFIRKKEAGGEVPLHQNWAFVNEHKCTSVSIWCPLVESNKRNGTLEVVPKSHKRFGEVRGPMIRSELLDINQEIIDSDLMLPIHAQAGEAVILDDSIVHYSSPNQTEGLRLAIQLILIPKEEKSIHFHMDHSKSREIVETLEVDQDFYMNFNPWKKPSDQIKRLESFNYQPFSLSMKEFEERVGQTRFDQKKSLSWWNNLKEKLVRL